MLTYYRSVGGKLQVVEGYTDGCWINATAPTAEELARVSRDTGLDLDYLSYPLDPDERSRFEREDGQLLIIMQTSYRLGEDSDIPYDTVPLGILHTDHCLVTVCATENPVVNDVVSGLVRRVSTAKKNRLTLQLFLRNAQRFLIDVRQINKQVERIEDRMETATRNKELMDLLKLEKSLVYFITGLKANEAMMERVKRDRIFEMYEEDSDLLDDVLIENLQAIEMANIASNILTSMASAFASIINNNVNQVVKVLTVTTILVAIPTLVTSIFGMNVPLPFQENPEGMWIVLGIATLLSAVLGLLFYRWRVF
ncbi:MULTISPECIES: magnesium transporter CorA family protein [Deinococcus]|uniref:Mg2+ transporter protein, CorA-like protein n=1 Tax=Deinococcus geothermalis (strain DSM 11300 / CIP 105573 / AG-3a) TaxID=319795 RepID=Q1IW79_DEIGD|nr:MULTISPECIES: magnesium transporter CorA family protein [Deinococcus]ABF46505.1 Mg2+ transporter protein, CorA-like protein [Deinococcus geothermalis DSM 11300]MBI0446606.1 magnesium transporter CorA family protein [Deinococcus sp. DB0503]TDE86825.1 magnesium transporter CorA family protein [Deinococcus sp. S9]